MTAQDDFYRQSEAFLSRALELDPVAATQMGEHRFDGRLADFTPDALAARNKEFEKALSQFEATGTTSFTLDAQIDHTLVVHVLKSFIRQYERLQRHRRDPGIYLDEVMGGVFILIIKDFAPVGQRLASALARIVEAPRVFREAQGNISARDVPLVWAEIALEQVKQAPGLFTDLLPGIARRAAPGMEGDFEKAGAAAAKAARGYGEFLQRQVMPAARGDFAVGRKIFDEMLSEDHMVDYDADELLETGWRLVKETEAAIESVAREIDPTRSARDILEEAKADHPAADGLLKAYEEAMRATRQFVVDHGIASIPENETLRVIETPVYARPILPYAAYMPAGMLEKKQDGLFFVTPVEPGTPADLAEQKLKGHYFAKLPITALHEGYPGHHLQLVWSNRQKTVPRRMGSMLSSLFVEGWAFYCEELMEQMGYIAKPIQRLARLSDQLWRAARIVIDSSIHTKGMTVREAIDLLVDRCGLEPANALAEVRRYTGSPTQPQSYLMGKIAILDMVREIRAAEPGIDLRKMHDDILGCGSLPPKLMRRKLLPQD